MTIRLIVGNIGSGKTLFSVREMLKYSKYMPIYTNIATKKIKNVRKLLPEYIIQKTIVDTKQSKDGTQKPIYELRPNIDFWLKHPKPLSIYIDEAHEFFSSRRSMSKQNQKFSSWLRLVRRFLEDKSGKSGDLVLLTQLTRSIDITYREMVNEVIFLVCHWVNNCTKCGFRWEDDSYSKMGDQKFCLKCNSFGMKKSNFYMIHYAFDSVDSANAFLEFGVKSYIPSKLFAINDVETIFKHYDTHQVDNILSVFY